MATDKNKKFLENISSKKNTHTARARRRKMEREINKLHNGTSDKNSSDVQSNDTSNS